jgi:hypothetical protein
MKLANEARAARLSAAGLGASEACPKVDDASSIALISMGQKLAWKLL